MQKLDNMYLSIFQSIFSVLGVVGVLVGIASLGAFVLFRFLGARWFEARFSERLESFKHEQNQQIDRMHYKINGLFDRKVKIHTKEFEYLPPAWDKLNDAFQASLYLVEGLRQYSNLNSATAVQLEQFLDRSGLDEWIKNELRTTPDKLKCYIEVRSRKELNEAANKLFEFRTELRKRGIFSRKKLGIGFPRSGT